MIRNAMMGVVAAGLAFGAAACDIDQTREGEMPEVEVRGGQMPEYDVDTAEVEVGTRPETINVPEVDVNTRRETVQVPTVGVDMPEDNEANERE